MRREVRPMIKMMKKLFAGMNNFDFDFDFNEMMLGLIVFTLMVLWMKTLYALWSCRFFAEILY
jgi:hypothetical protein